MEINEELLKKLKLRSKPKLKDIVRPKSKEISGENLTQKKSFKQQEKKNGKFFIENYILFPIYSIKDLKLK